MSALHATQVLLQITDSLSDISKVTLETSYGLVLVIDSDKSLTVRQTTAKKSGSDSENDDLAKSEPDPEHKQPGYKYRVFPDYGAGFVWYEPAWPGNPKDSFMVDEEELEERYGDAWNKAYNSWMDRYTAAFEMQECHLGSHSQPFLDMEKRRAWVVEGLLLACWLSLQSDVENVEYGPNMEKVHLNKDSLGVALQSTLEELDKFLT